MKTKVFKYTAILMILAGGLASCKEQEPDHPCMVRVRPKNLPHIDWENYNNVQPFFVYHGIIDWNPWMYADTGRTVKVYGWIDDRLDWEFGIFRLREDSTRLTNHYPLVPIWINGEPDVVHSVMAKVRDADRTKKIFVRGKFMLFAGAQVSVGPPHYCGGLLVSGGVRIYGIDDFYFE